MKRFIVFCLLLASALYFYPKYASAVYVNGYYRSNGTYVNGYERTAPDGNPYNNYSFPGNYNPNTGSITGGDPSTYLNNYYNKSSGSSYSYPSYSTYSYPTTPTCPSNSYYDGISSCKCSYGYVVSGNSCVSADSLCHDQFGYNSSYDSLSNQCVCDSGYIIGSSGQCTNANSYCSSKLGLMSQYNRSTKRCECMTGYEFNGSSCEYKSSYSSYKSLYSDTTSACPIHSKQSSTDSTKCTCDYGYQANSTKDGCVISTTDTSSNTAKPYTYRRTLQLGSQGEDVKQLQMTLQKLKYLPQGIGLGYYGAQTQAAVMAYQVKNEIKPASGTFGPITRALFNLNQ